MRNREHVTHIIGKGLAKALCIGRHWTPFVPLNGISLPNRPTPVCHADDSQCITISSQKRWNDRHALPCLRERQQGMRRAALEQNVGLDIREAASRVK